MRVKMFIAIMVLLLVQAGQAEARVEMTPTPPEKTPVPEVTPTEAVEEEVPPPEELLWSYDTGDYVYDVSISSDGSYIAAGSLGDGNVRLFNREGKLLWSCEVDALVFDVSSSSDGSYIAAGSGERGDNVHLFNRKGELLWSYHTGGDVRGVSISSDGSYIAAGSCKIYKERSGERGEPGNVVYLFNRKGKLLWSYQADEWVQDVSISSDGSYIAAGSNDYKVYLFNRGGELLWSYKTGDTIRGVSISSDGSYIAAGSGDNVYLFNREGEPLWSYKTGYDEQDVSISSDGSYIAAGSCNHNVYLFNRMGELLWSYKTGYRVEGVSISSDGAYLATGSECVYLFVFENPELTSSSGAIDAAKAVVKSEMGRGFGMDEAESLLSQAEGAFSTGDYTKTRELAGAAKANAESIAKEASAAENVINEVESVIRQEESKGFNLVEAESLLSQAEEAFSTGDYTKASELANHAKPIALDIDGDGTPNDADFAPTIDNYLIYAGVAILLVVSVITIITGLKVIQRFKLERERKAARRREQEREERERLMREAEKRREAERRKEQERIRTEEEKRRREEKEKRRLERMKQDILDEIDEVTKER